MIALSDFVLAPAILNLAIPCNVDAGKGRGGGCRGQEAGATGLRFVRQTAAAFWVCSTSGPIITLGRISSLSCFGSSAAAIADVLAHRGGLTAQSTAFRLNSALTQKCTASWPRRGSAGVASTQSPWRRARVQEELQKKLSKAGTAFAALLMDDESDDGSDDESVEAPTPTRAAPTHKGKP
eukprot:6202503-Pleurochrysis_carterae.AAC.1